MRPFLFGLLTAVSIATSFAQTNSDNKNRLTFDSGLKATPPPAQVTSQVPPEVLERFFSLLRQEKIEPAYQALVAGTILGERKEDIDALKQKTQKAIDSYGAISGYEIVDTLTAGKSLIRYTCISLNEDLPLRWRFYFYQGPNGWRLVDLRIDDGLVELFESIKKQPPTP